MRVPVPAVNSAVDGESPVRIGTRIVAPNISQTRVGCSLESMIRGVDGHLDHILTVLVVVLPSRSSQVRGMMTLKEVSQSYP